MLSGVVGDGAVFWGAIGRGVAASAIGGFGVDGTGVARVRRGGGFAASRWAGTGSGLNTEPGAAGGGASAIVEGGEGTGVASGFGG